MITEELHEQAALYALDALPAEERNEFLREVRKNQKLAILIEELRNASVIIARSAAEVEPPSTLKAHILNLASKEKPSSTPTLPARPSHQSKKTSAAHGLNSLIPWALAAGFAIFAGILWGNNQRYVSAEAKLAAQHEVVTGLFTKIADLENNIEIKDKEIAGVKDLLQQLQKSNRLANVQLATLSSKLDASFFGSVAWDKDSQEGVLQVRRLPEPTAGHDYQLWLIESGRSLPVSAGIFRVNPDGSARVHFTSMQPVTDVTTFAVTLEKSGGESEPKGSIIITTQ